MSDDKAQKRASKAIEKLRRILLRRGVAVSAAALGGLMGTNAAQFAPSYLATHVANASLDDAKLSTSVCSLLETATPTLFLRSRMLAFTIASGFVVAFGFVLCLWPHTTPSSSTGMSLQSQIVRHPPRTKHVRATIRSPPAATVVSETKAVPAVTSSNPPVTISNLQVATIRLDAFRSPSAATKATNLPSVSPSSIISNQTTTAENSFLSPRSYTSGSDYNHLEPYSPFYTPPINSVASQRIPQVWLRPQQNGSAVATVVGGGRAWAPAQPAQPAQKKTRSR
jgi:hypothetical protein